MSKNEINTKNKKRINDKEIEEKENFYISPKVFQEELWQFYQYDEKVEELNKVYNSEENVALRESYELLSDDDNSPEAQDIRQRLKDLDDYYNSPQAKELRRMRRRWYNQCGRSCIKLVKGLANNSRFSGYTWRDEMINDALLKITKALEGRKYDFSTGFNPFSYFNRIAWREFTRRIKIEKKHYETSMNYGAEHARDYAEGSDVAIYTKPSLMENFGELFNEENSSL